MPTGLPDAAALLQSIQSKFLLTIEYLQVPPFSLVKDQFFTAYKDVIQASHSSFVFLEVISRPLLILISLISRYLLIVMKIVAQHTIYHGILALKEAWRQLTTASRWFVAYQRTLSMTTIYMEIAFIFLLIGLYAIRKYIQKKRYVERASKWYQQKRTNAVLRYNSIVDKVAQTSMILALLLPHLLYLSATGIVKYFLPNVVRYFATKTLLCELIKFYIPFIRTISIVHKWRSFDLLPVKEGATDNSGYLSMIRKKPVGTSKKNDSGTIRQVGKNENDYNTKNQSTRTRLTDEHMQVFEDAMNLLKYWVVVAMLTAIIQTMKLMPIFGRILSNMNLKQNASSLPWKQKRLTWLNRIKPSAEFFQEISLLFFIWLRLLPTSFMGGKRGNSVDTIQEKSTNYKNGGKVAQFSSCPVDILYSFLSPAVVTMVSSQNILIEKVGMKNTNQSGSLVKSAAGWCTRFLDVMVWTKLISESSRNRIISTLTECSDLLPAMVTLLMPGYFTSYGVIYVQLVVPVANSSKSIAALNLAKANAEILCEMNVVSRFLQYWIVEEIISWILSSFYPILVWIPFNQHFVLLLFAYAQLQGATLYLYNLLESELVSFGILHAHSCHNAGDLNDTVTMKVLNSFAKRFPSSQESCDGKNTNSESSKADNVKSSGEDELQKQKSKSLDAELDKSLSLDHVRKGGEDDDYVSVEKESTED